MILVWPSREYLPGYIDALERGWSPDNMRPVAAKEQLAQIAGDADAFLASQVDREAAGHAIRLPDGTTVPRLPGYVRWMWDGEFCGRIGLRWQPGTEALPLHCLGHIGYTVVPWKRRLGYATQALREMLREARAEGLRYVEITTSPDNVASRRVIEANGGVLVEEFLTPPALGGTRELRYHVRTGDRDSGVRYRPMTTADIPAMAACRLTDPAAGPADTRMSAYLEGTHHPQQALLPRVGYVAVAGEVVVGYIAGHQTRRHGCEGEVQYLFVAPVFRRQRIAMSLLRLLADWFQAQGVKKVCVSVDADSPSAQPFYDSVGASPLPLRPYWYAWGDIARIPADS